MKVFIERTNKELELNFEGTVEDLLKHLSLNSEEILVVINNKISTLDIKLKEEDEVKIISIISGG